MGSLPSSPPGNAAGNYRVYASFGRSGPAPGATTSNWLESYNPSDNAWRHAGAMPGLPPGHVLKDFAMVPLAGSLFVIGGRLCRNETDVAVVPTVLRHDVASGEWSPCAPLATPRFCFAAAACDGRIYVAGGLCGLSGGARGTSAAEVYDPSADQWAALPNMGTRRYKCVGVPWLPGKLHVIGGFAEPEAEEEEQQQKGTPSGAGEARKGGWLLEAVAKRSSAEVFDVRRGEWELAAGMWQLDVPPNQIVCVGGRLFSSGDCLNNWKGHVEVYDGKLGIWSILEGSHLGDLSSLFPPAPELQEEEGAAVERVYLTMAPIGTQLYFVAGYRRQGEAPGSPAAVSVVHTFETALGELAAGEGAEAWRTFEPVAEGTGKLLFGHCCVARVG